MRGEYGEGCVCVCVFEIECYIYVCVHIFAASVHVPVFVCTDNLQCVYLRHACASMHLYRHFRKHIYMCMAVYLHAHVCFSAEYMRACLHLNMSC